MSLHFWKGNWDMTTKPYANNRADYIINLIGPSKNDRVLNIGVSNIPEIEIKLENKVRECWIIDIDRKKLNKAKRFLKKTKLICGDVTNNVQLKKNYFDKIIIIEVLEHLDEDGMAVDIIKSLLKKGGVVVAASPNNALFHLINPVKYFEHKRHYSNEEFKNLFQSRGFIIEHFNIVENWELLANLYTHLFFKFVLKKIIPFATFNKYSRRTYMKQNKRGLDLIIKAKKVN